MERLHVLIEIFNGIVDRDTAVGKVATKLPQGNMRQFTRLSRRKFVLRIQR